MSSERRPRRMLSWNLNVRTPCGPSKVALLQSFAWDVIALQEVAPEAFDALQPQLGATGVYRRDDQRRAEHDYGSALLVRPPCQVVDHGLVEELPWPERGVWADVQIEGEDVVRVVSFHAPNAAGQGEEMKMAAYEAMHSFVQLRPGPMILGMDANAGWDCWPDEDDSHWATVVAEHGEGIWRWHRFLLAPDELKPQAARTRLRDGWRDALGADEEGQARLRALRPDGPTAVTYFNNVHGRVSPLRYDHVYVSPEIEVDGLEHHYADAIGARSDHALVETTFTVGASQL